MNKKSMLLSLAVVLMLFSSAVAESSDTVVSLRYGVVEDVQVVDVKSKHAGGAVIGGLVGAMLGPRHRGLKMVGGAAAGAAIQGAATGGEAQQYTVKLRDGGTIEISTEQDDIRKGDCVVIEQGEHANIRRVSSIHCEAQKPTAVPPHHQSAADSCQKVKNELANAKTDEEINAAIKKVRILCED